MQRLEQEQLDRLDIEIKAFDSALQEYSRSGLDNDYRNPRGNSNPANTFDSQLTQKANEIRKLIKFISNQQSITPVEQNQLNAYTRRFMKQIQKFHKIQVEQSERKRKQLKRQLKISGKAGDSVGEQELDRMVDDMMMSSNGQHQQQIFAPYGGYEQRQLVDRHQQLLQISRSIEELQNLFLDLQTLVDSQHQLVLSVSDNINQTAADSTEATQQLQVAIKHKKSSRKKKIWLCVCLVILLAVAGIVVYFQVIQPLLEEQEKAQQ